MNTIRILAVALLTVLSVTAFAQKNESVFKVSGNCNMCKNRIEKAAYSLPGINSFEWNVKTKQAKVSFDYQRVTLTQLQKKIAEAGHDSEGFNAPAISYTSLPHCCRYERKVQSPISPAKTDK
jgi:copper chaperone CopZ